MNQAIPRISRHLAAEIQRERSEMRNERRLLSAEVMAYRKERKFLWRVSASLIVAIIVQLGTSIYWAGQLTNQVKSNTHMIGKLSSTPERLSSIESISKQNNELIRALFASQVHGGQRDDDAGK